MNRGLFSHQILSLKEQMHYSNTDIVCQCNMVTFADVQKFVEAFPEMPIMQLKSVLKIGTRCGCCQFEDCPTIDIKFEKAVHIVKSLTQL